MTAVRKEVDREPDPGKKVELMKKKLGLVFNNSFLTSLFGWSFQTGRFEPFILDGHFVRSFRTVTLDGHFGRVI